MFLPLCVAISLIAAGSLVPAHAFAAKSATAAKSGNASASKARKAMRQWTGYVTALDKTTITVEKRGKAPESKVFTKHAEMSTVGDVEKDARVTVYYREEGGRATAHRVVVKSKTAAVTGGAR
jgi:hypothetical protein